MELPIFKERMIDFWTHIENGFKTRLQSPDYHYQRLAIFFFLLISLPILYLARGERSPWILTTTPGEYPSFEGVNNSQFGYNYILGDQPFMVENIYYVQQVLALNGYPKYISTSFPYRRSLTPFIASIFSPLLGGIGSILAVSYLAWAIAAYLAWRFTLRLSNDQLAAFFSVILVSLGIGFITHLHDYSPHLSSFTLYYLGILLVFESRVWKESRPLKTHLFLGIVLALIAINYSNGLYLIAAYFLVAIWHNRWWQVIIAALIASSAQFLYTENINLQLFLLNKVWPGEGISEYHFLALSLQTWATLLLTPSKLLDAILGGLSQYTFFEIPPLIFLELFGWVPLIRTRQLWLFFLAFFFIPIFTDMMFLFVATTRGYVVYGISILIYVPFAIIIAKMVRSSTRYVKIFAAALLFVTIAAQFFWSTAFLWGFNAPIKAFLNAGYNLDQWLYLWQEKGLARPQVYNLTDHESTPALFGGDATLKDAGMVILDHPFSSVAFSWIWALGSRTFIVLLFVLLIFIGVSSRRQRYRSLIPAILVLWFLPSILPLVSPPKTVNLYLGSILIPAGRKLTYTVNISEQFIRELRKYSNSRVRIYAASGTTPGSCGPCGAVDNHKECR